MVRAGQSWASSGSCCKGGAPVAAGSQRHRLCASFSRPFSRPQGNSPAEPLADSDKVSLTLDMNPGVLPWLWNLDVWSCVFSWDRPEERLL